MNAMASRTDQNETGKCIRSAATGFAFVDFMRMSVAANPLDRGIRYPRGSIEGVKTCAAHCGSGKSRLPPPAVRAYLAVIGQEAERTAAAYRKSRAA